MLQFMNSVVLCRPRFVQQVEGIEDHTSAMTGVLCVERPLSLQDPVGREE